MKPFPHKTAVSCLILLFTGALFKLLNLPNQLIVNGVAFLLYLLIILPCFLGLLFKELSTIVSKIAAIIISLFIQWSTACNSDLAHELRLPRHCPGAFLRCSKLYCGVITTTIIMNEPCCCFTYRAMHWILTLGQLRGSRLLLRSQLGSVSRLLFRRPCSWEWSDGMECSNSGDFVGSSDWKFTRILVPLVGWSGLWFLPSTMDIVVFASRRCRSKQPHFRCRELHHYRGTAWRGQ